MNETPKSSSSVRLLAVTLALVASPILGCSAEVEPVGVDQQAVMMRIEEPSCSACPSTHPYIADCEDGSQVCNSTQSCPRDPTGLPRPKSCPRDPIPK